MVIPWEGRKRGLSDYPSTQVDENERYSYACCQDEKGLVEAELFYRVANESGPDEVANPLEAGHC